MADITTVESRNVEGAEDKMTQAEKTQERKVVLKEASWR